MIDQLKCDKLSQEILTLDMFQRAVKIIINQVYGAFGNQYFYFSNKDIAESITLQGQDLIQFSITICNKYFMERWHLDTKLHEMLGIDSYKINKIDSEVVIYVDTDSNYVVFQTVLDSIQGLSLKDTREKLDLVLKIFEYRFEKYLDNAFVHYAKQYGVENRMKFKLENISDCGIWVAKKNYAYRVIYEDFYRAPKVSAKGLPCTKPSYPKLAREILWDLLEDLLNINHGVIHEIHLVPKLKSFYNKFLSSPMDDICYNMYVNGLDKYALLKSEYDLIDGVDEKGDSCKNAINKSTGIIHQIETLKKGIYNAVITDEVGSYYTVKGTGNNVKGCLWYNNILIQSGNTKYNKIKSGDKIKFYYAKCDNPKVESFAYPSGQFHDDLNYSIDYRRHFFHCVVTPLNSLLEAIGKQKLDHNFRRDIKIKFPKSDDIESCFPFYALNNVSLEYYEIPKKFTKYILSNSDIPEYLNSEYNEIIGKYANDLIVISNKDLNSYIKTRKTAILKKKNKELLGMFNDNQLRYYNTALDYLKKQLKFKVEYHENTFEIILYLTKFDKRYTLKIDDMLRMNCAENYVSLIKSEFEVELATISMSKKVKNAE